jgi:hypothetical protein
MRPEQVTRSVPYTVTRQVPHTTFVKVPRTVTDLVATVVPRTAPPLGCELSGCAVDCAPYCPPVCDPVCLPFGDACGPTLRDRLRERFANSCRMQPLRNLMGRIRGTNCDPYPVSAFDTCAVPVAPPVAPVTRPPSVTVEPTPTLPSKADPVRVSPVAPQPRSTGRD